MLIVSASGEDTASPLQDLFELVNQFDKRKFTFLFVPQGHKNRQETRHRLERSAGRGGQGERAVISGEKSPETARVPKGNLFSASPPVVSLVRFLSIQEMNAPGRERGYYRE